MVKNPPAKAVDLGDASSVSGLGDPLGEGTTEDEMVGWHHRLNGHEFI